jgi:signal transduction histidine kinase
MRKSLLPDNEEKRISALIDYLILDTPPEDVFDDITSLASLICETPYSCITFVAGDRQWFKSAHNLDVKETSRDVSFCSHVVYENQLIVINDALKDPRFHDNPLVKEGIKIRFYAGAPLTTFDGLNLGALCVIDNQPKVLSAHQREQLVLLSKIIMKLLQSRKKLAEDEIKLWQNQETNRLKDVFLTHVSHELLTPLNAIIGLSELLHFDAAELLTLEQQKDLATIKNNAHNLLNIITNILEFSNAHFGQLEFFYEPANLAKDLDDVIARLNEELVQKHITFTKNISADLGDGNIDRVWFKQIIYYFLSNAIKFSPDKGRISIQLLRESDSMIRIEVSDNGIGIKPEELANIFKPFKQLDTGLTRKYHGIGIELALAKQVVEAQDGVIGVNSTPNQGSVFYATLKFSPN